MASKIPSWCWRITWLLSFSAGNINVLGILGTGYHGITHLTGSTSMFSIAVAALQANSVCYFGAVIFSFLVGAVLSGFIIQDVSFKLGRRYPIALLLVAGLLTVSEMLLNAGEIAGVYAAACACGLQNAMMSTFSNATIRTTHLSGMFTDIGIYIGHALRGLPVDRTRLTLCMVVVSGYFCGGVVGAFLFRHLVNSAFYLSILISLFTALSLWIRSGSPRE